MLAGSSGTGRATDTVEAPVSFQKVVTNLAEKLPEETRSEVSFAYCFICLLHLANENGLAIEGNAEMDDLRVTQPTA